MVANIDTKAQQNTGAIEIPGGLSFLTQNSFTSGKVEGIKDLQAKSEAQYGPGNYIPDVPGIFLDIPHHGSGWLHYVISCFHRLGIKC